MHSGHLNASALHILLTARLLGVLALLDTESNLVLQLVPDEIKGLFVADLRNRERVAALIEKGADTLQQFELER